MRQHESQNINPMLYKSVDFIFKIAISNGINWHGPRFTDVWVAVSTGSGLLFTDREYWDSAIAIPSDCYAPNLKTCGLQPQQVICKTIPSGFDLADLSID